MTGDLITRIAQHKGGETPGFTSKYNVHSLVYLEYFGEIQTAIRREKAMKKWPRQWKINLIERDNPQWQDLYAQLTGITHSAAGSLSIHGSPDKPEDDMRI